ncbi:MAG: DeoR/GlpR family DNA-binding transcription regulator [Fusobacteriaceae bacterium]|jgi:DeoR family fructose operon transcriptional repressor|nr:DeoR/GlpR family DNA-binding transcription regulator [Fusobacteriaceae bacterium]
MLNIQRCNIILELIEKNKNMQMKDIVKTLNVSEATVRRDLMLLEEKGKIRRVHGGAVLPDYIEEDILSRRNIFSAEKTKIAKTAAALVRDGSAVYLDAGTTTGAMIPFLAEKERLVVITNGLSHLEELTKYKIKAYVTGGRVKGKTAALVSGSAVLSLRNYRYDMAFMGANAVNEEGYWTPDEEEAVIKSAALRNCAQVWFLCDSSKFFKQSFIKFADLNEGTLLSEGEIPEGLRAPDPRSGERSRNL